MRKMKTSCLLFTAMLTYSAISFSLAGQSQDISPYVFCNNNPLRFIDPDGRYIVGTNNRRIYKTADGSLSKNASKDVVRIVSAMSMTNTGKKQVQKMMNSRYPITLELSDQYNPKKCGECSTETQTVTTTLKGKTKVINSILKASITIFTGSIVKDTNFSMYTLDEAIGLIGVHESEHGTNPNAVGHLIHSDKIAEERANAKMEKAKQELLEKKKENSEGKQEHDQQIENEKNASL